MYADITLVIDKYFAFMEELDALHYIPELTPEDMKDTSRPPSFKESQRWKVIDSTVTDQQIQAYEHVLGMKLPNSYKYFLQYKNFIELILGEYQIVFFKNLSTHWMETLLEQSEFYREHLEGRALIPFADYSDFGVVCFDLNAVSGEDAETPIVWLDHEDGFEQVQPVAKNLTHLFRTSELHLDEWIKSSRDARQQSI